MGVLDSLTGSPERSETSLLPRVGQNPACCHADIHPGNILVSYGKADPLPFLAVLDVGVCQTLTKHQRDVSHEFLRAIVTGDWLHVGDAVLKMAQRQDYCDVHKFSEVWVPHCPCPDGPNLLVDPKRHSFFRTSAALHFFSGTSVFFSSPQADETFLIGT